MALLGDFGSLWDYFGVTLELLESFWGQCGSLSIDLITMMAGFHEIHVFPMDFNGFMNVMKQFRITLGSF